MEKPKIIQRLNNVESSLVDIAHQPTLIAPEANYTQAFTRIVDQIKTNGKGTILLAQGKTYVGDINLNEASNVIITGGGTLKGTINAYGKDMTSGNKWVDGSKDILIQDITIDGETLRNGINFKWYIGATISKVKIIKCLKAINFELVEEVQHCSRFIFSNNRFVDCNYILYSNSAMVQGSYALGDFTFTDNMCETRTTVFSNIYNIWLKGIDGIICKNNTFFFTTPGITNIFLDNFTWANIEGNQLFEPSEHGIRCENGSNLSIVNNKFAWAKKQTIYIKNCITVSITGGNQINQKDDAGVNVTNRTGIYVIDCPYFDGIISDNNFYFLNEYAIQIINSSNIGISDNFMQNKYSTLEPIKIDIETCNFINVSDNIEKDYTYNAIRTFFGSLGENNKINVNGNYYNGLPIVNRGLHSPIIGTHTSGTTLNIDSKEVILLNSTVPTTIIAITSDYLSTVPRIVTLYAQNGNTSISNTITGISMRRVASGGYLTIPSGESITFLVKDNTYIELSRSFPIVTGATINTTATTLDASITNQFNLVQPSPVTITSITGGKNGDEITMVAFNANTTLQNSTNDSDPNIMRLQGGLNANIPNNGTIKLRYMASRWYEITRNF